jgi:topoisomerase-4 subunit A
VTKDDIVRLTEIKIKRISKFDIDKAILKIKSIEQELEQIKYNLENLTAFAIDYFKKLKVDYGKNRNRKTEIKIFDDVDAKKVVVKNSKLYVNRLEGFIGTSIRRDEFVQECSDIDDVIVFTDDGKMVVTKIDKKKFVAKNIIHVAVFKRKDKRTVYNVIYRDGKKGTSYIKRFFVTGITRDKIYDLTIGNKDSKILYFTANPNGESEIVNVILRQTGSIKKLKWELDFADMQIKGRAVKGNIVSKYPVRKIELKEKGVSTLKPRKIWYDTTIRRLNLDSRGELIGAFKGDDKLLIINSKAEIRAVAPDLNMHFEDEMLILQQWIPEQPITAVYFDPDKKRYFLKRFLVETENKTEEFIKENGELLFVCTDWRPVLTIDFVKPQGKPELPPMEVKVEEFIAVKGIKALGNQLTAKRIKNIELKEALPYEPPKPPVLEEIEVQPEDEQPEEESADNETNGGESQTRLDF